MNGTYNFVTMLSALFLLPLCLRYGGKRVHAGTLLLAGLSLGLLSQTTSQALTLVPMIGLGICWASMVGVPYLMVASMVPRERTGVYMGILNMMIVVPMLIQTLTFGWIFENLLDDRGTNAILMAGVLLGCAALAMLWVNAPESEDEESPIMPLGAPRKLSVYDQVIVGSDGTPASLNTVGHAAGVANAAEARLVVVSAYQDDDAPYGGSSRPGVTVRQELRGRDAAMAAVRASLRELTTDRVRTIDSRVVRGDPASALLEVAGNNPKNLIVVGNRGVGAREGELLGEVPAAVVRNATCNVLIIQTSDDPTPHDT
jgi:maltose/moltooligosaccharide transporter